MVKLAQSSNLNMGVTGVCHFDVWNYTLKIFKFAKNDTPEFKGHSHYMSLDHDKNAKFQRSSGPELVLGDTGCCNLLSGATPINLENFKK